MLTVALLSMLYLTSSNIGALIDYVGFATWVINSTIFNFFFIKFFLVEYWCISALSSVAALEAARPDSAYSSEFDFSYFVYYLHFVYHCLPHG